MVKAKIRRVWIWTNRGREPIWAVHFGNLAAEFYSWSNALFWANSVVSEKRKTPVD